MPIKKTLIQYPNKSNLKRKPKTMAKTKNRFNKMNFQKQSRAKAFEYKPLSDNDKYIIRLAGYRKELQNRKTNEDISRITRGSL
jgi:hypothetical protein